MCMSENQSQKIEQLETELVSLRIKIARIEDYISQIPSFSDFADIEDFNKEDEPLYDRAVELVKKHKVASASLIQKYLSIGYARAVRIMDKMEEEKIIGPVDGANPRKVLIND